MDGSEVSSVPLVTASCEVEATQPQMFLGLPRKLSSLLAVIGLLAIVVIDSWQFGVTVAASLCVVWVAAKGAVSRDLWGFDNVLAWLMTDARFLDLGGRDGWGGPRLCALPLSDRSTRGVGHAAR